jgi:hypothetical protein
MTRIAGLVSPLKHVIDGIPAARTAAIGIRASKAGGRLPVLAESPEPLLLQAGTHVAHKLLPAPRRQDIQKVGSFGVRPNISPADAKAAVDRYIQKRADFLSDGARTQIDALIAPDADRSSDLHMLAACPRGTSLFRSSCGQLGLHLCAGSRDHELVLSHLMTQQPLIAERARRLMDLSSGLGDYGSSVTPSSVMSVVEEFREPLDPRKNPHGGSFRKNALDPFRALTFFIGQGLLDCLPAAHATGDQVGPSAAADPGSCSDATWTPGEV